MIFMNRITLQISAGLSFTKFILYEGKKILLYNRINHTKEDMDRYIFISEQVEYRSNLVLDVIRSKGFNLNKIDKVISGAESKTVIIDNLGGFINDFKIEDNDVYIRDSFYIYSELIANYIMQLTNRV